MNVVGITIGTGVGGGVITNGRLLEGAHGYAGELGHFPTHAGGKKCLCGLRGCYERYASTSALIRKAVTEDPDLKSGRVLFSAAESGDKHALALLDEWIEEIAYGIAGLVHVFDPQLVLIGGGVSAQEKLLIDPLRKKVLSMIMPDFADELEFRRAELGNDAGMIGAVYYLLSRENISRKM
jgi:glucokinase